MRMAGGGERASGREKSGKVQGMRGNREGRGLTSDGCVMVMARALCRV